MAKMAFASALIQATYTQTNAYTDTGNGESNDDDNDDSFFWVIKWLAVKGLEGDEKTDVLKSTKIFLI